jgi:nicotinate-nucleotide pyrophosphorylase (carboxylating)
VKSEPFGPLDPALYREVVRRALAEDLEWGDVTTDATVPPDLRGRGVVLAGSACVLAGIDLLEETFRQLDPGVVVARERQDAQTCAAGQVVARIEGQAAALLTAEGTALNFLRRLSGVATLAHRFVEAAGGRVIVLDTRKTTPLLRALEKYAVRAGGGTNHRLSLSDGILIKDNHVRLAGGIRQALDRMRAAGHDMPIEVEVQSFEQLDEALAAGATRIMADNFPDHQLREVVRRTLGRAQVEVSGGVTLERMPAIAASGVAFVSVGALTHSAPGTDFSFEVVAI